MSTLVTTIIVLLLLVIAYALYSALCLLRNYLVARTLGIPVRIILVDQINPLWMLISQPVVSLLRRLPFGLGNNGMTRWNYLGWEYPLRWKAHYEMGDVFILCSPSRLWFYLGTPELVTALLKRPNEFPHDSKLTAMLDCFGPNIATALGRPWQKMRKLMGSCFTDAAYDLVWRESVSQAQGVGRYWERQASIRTVAHDVRTLFLNIMSQAGFGKAYPFKGYHEKQIKLEGTSLSYKDALQTILENSIVIMVLGTKFLAQPWLPKPLRRLHYACAAFQGYLTELYNTEKNSVARQSSGTNLMTLLLRASEEEKAGGLTENEIYGNMFLFNVGGHDTTTHSFVWVIYFLAGSPEVQEWVHEEILHVFGDRPPSEWNYKADFHRLRRCLSVFHETLRLYSPVGTAKWTGEHSVPFQVGEKTLVIPPRTMMMPSHACVQTDPKHWGPESLTWMPSRWITKSEDNGLDGEEMITPVRGSFISWADGHRDCPGKKFSQVEAVAAIAILLKYWRLNPVTNPGESLESARERVLRFIVEDTGAILMVQMLHPERCPLVCVKR